MFFNILYSLIVSIIIIFVVHNIFEYLKNTLTTPKVKDMINKPKYEYDKINSVINSRHINNGIPVDNSIPLDTSHDDNNIHKIDTINDNILTEQFDKNNIKSELKDFFKQLNNDNGDNRHSLDMMPSNHDMMFADL
jgi:hypothetical protein